LLFSAAIDLAYMLFTPGPDEALQPVIIGIAAAVLILVLKFKETIEVNNDKILTPNVIWPVLSIFILVCAMTFLFYIRQRYEDEEERRAGSQLTSTPSVQQRPRKQRPRLGGSNRWSLERFR
jgi:hypothetical protein